MDQNVWMTSSSSTWNNLSGHKFLSLGNLQLQEREWNFVTLMISFSFLVEVVHMLFASMIFTHLTRCPRHGSIAITLGILRTTPIQRREQVTQWHLSIASSISSEEVTAKIIWRTCIFSTLIHIQISLKLIMRQNKQASFRKNYFLDCDRCWTNKSFQTSLSWLKESLFTATKL